MLRRLFITTGLLLISSVLHAETIIVKDGVTFELPIGLNAQPNQNPPVVGAWINAENTVSVALLVLSRSDKEMYDVAKEFNNWPSVALSTVKGFGNSISKTLESTLQAPCSFTGNAEERDVSNISFWISVNTTCKTAEGFSLKSRVIQTLLRDAMVLIRIDSNPPTEKLGEKVTATIWNSIQVRPDAQLKLPYIAEDVKGDKPSLSGGKGLFLKNYSTINSPSLIGHYIGAIVSSILIGMLITILCLKIKLPPIPSLVIAQVFIILLRAYGAEENGAWELDPILYIVSSTIAIATLWRWAKKKCALYRSSSLNG